MYGMIILADGGLDRVFTAQVSHSLDTKEKFVQWFVPSRGAPLFTDTFKKLKAWRNSVAHGFYVELQARNVGVL